MTWGAPAPHGLRRTLTEAPVQPRRAEACLGHVTGLPMVNGADRPTPAVPDGAARPLPPAFQPGARWVYCSPTGRGLLPQGADMGSMRRTRSVDICAGKVPYGRCGPRARQATAVTGPVTAS